MKRRFWHTQELRLLSPSVGNPSFVDLGTRPLMTQPYSMAHGGLGHGVQQESGGGQEEFRRGQAGPEEVRRWSG